MVEAYGSKAPKGRESWVLANDEECSKSWRRKDTVRSAEQTVLGEHMVCNRL